MLLYDYFRSSAAYRVRIALNLKGVECRRQSVNLVDAEQRSEAYRAHNPQGLVPALELDDGTVLTQSLAICEYLEEIVPQPALLPADPIGRARVRSLAQIVACDIHPLNNLRVLKYLTGELAIGEDAKLGWYRRWVDDGLRAMEALLRGAQTGQYCHGETPTLADVCLVPQLFNARRFDCDLTHFPTVVSIGGRCEQLSAFAAAHPAKQPDAS